MNKIKEKIKSFEKENSKFYQELTDAIDKKLEDNTAKIPEKYDDILSLISNEYVNQDDAEKTKELLNEFIKDELLEKIHNYMLSINSWFFDTKPLRILQKNNQYQLYTFFDLAMDNFILQINDTIIKNIQSVVSSCEFSDDEIENCLQALDYSADIYASRFMSKSFISKDFCEKSGIDKDSSDYFSELIDKNRLEIKTNYIIKKLNLLEP